MSVDLKHITKIDRQKVYPPSQDTFLLIDSIISDLQFLQDLSPSFILEIGVGSGAVLGTLSRNPLLSCFYLGVDINPNATSLARKTLESNNCQCFDLVTLDVFQRLNLENKVDVVVCNPPYVITSPEEYLECQKRKDISSSFAGGENGREFIDKLLILCNQALTDHGVLYMLYEEHNGNFQGTKISEARTGCEGLAVIRITKDELNLNIL